MRARFCASLFIVLGMVLLALGAAPSAAWEADPGMIPPADQKVAEGAAGDFDVATDCTGQLSWPYGPITFNATVYKNEWCYYTDLPAGSYWVSIQPNSGSWSMVVTSQSGSVNCTATTCTFTLTSADRVYVKVNGSVWDTTCTLTNGTGAGGAAPCTSYTVGLDELKKVNFNIPSGSKSVTVSMTVQNGDVDVYGSFDGGDTWVGGSANWDQDPEFFVLTDLPAGGTLTVGLYGYEAGTSCLSVVFSNTNAATNFGGTWSTSAGDTVTCTQSGANVDCYGTNWGHHYWGTVSGNVLTGYWFQTSSNPNPPEYYGDIVLNMAADNNSCVGTWRWTNETSWYNWSWVRLQ